MDTPGKTARKKRCTAQADVSQTSFTEAALSRLSRLWPESALLGAGKGFPSRLGADRPRRATSPPGPHTPRVVAAGPDGKRGRAGWAPAVDGATSGAMHSFEAENRPFLRPTPLVARGLWLPSRSGSESTPVLCNQFQEPKAPRAPESAENLLGRPPSQGYSFRRAPCALRESRAREAK